MPKISAKPAKTKKSTKVEKSDSVTLLLQRGVIKEVLPELAPMLNMHRKPLTKSWAYAQSFDTLMLAHSLLNQILGVHELLKTAITEEGKKLSAQEIRFYGHVSKSIAQVRGVLTAKAKRYA